VHAGLVPRRGEALVSHSSPAAPPPDVPTAPRVLVVEDEGIIAIDLAQRIERMGYVAAAIVSKGEDALRFLEAEVVDLVLLDIRLAGELDGIATARSLREGGRGASAPGVIFLTSHADTRTIADARTTGPYGYLLKPYRENELRGTIEMALGKRRVEREAERAAMAERLLGLGTLAAGLAHEVNNPLTGVCANVDYAVERIDSLEAHLAPFDAAAGATALADIKELRETLTDIAASASRIRQVVGDMLKVGGSGLSEVAHVDLADVIDEALHLVDAELSLRAEVTVTRAPGLVVRGDADALVRGVAALLRNAAFAIEDTGRPRGHVHVELAREADLAVLSVHDDGAGFSDEGRARAFDPFWSTREPGRGIGLGLTIVDRIVREHGGEVRIVSRMGQGSAVSLRLPLGP